MKKISNLTQKNAPVYGQVNTNSLLKGRNTANTQLAGLSWSPINFKSLSLLLLLCLCTMAMQAQQLTLKMYNKGAYDANFKVYWNGGSWESGKRMAGQSAETTLPSSARGIRIEAWVSEVFSWRKFKTQSIAQGGELNTYGTVFNPSAEWKPESYSGDGHVDTSTENVNELNGAGDSKLHLAIRQGDRSEISRLFRKEINRVNHKNNRGYTPLHEAVQKNDQEIVRELIDKGADPSKADNSGKKPLDMAIEKGYTDMVTTLISKGASIHSSSRSFEKVIQMKKTDMVKVLIERGADKNFAIEKSIHYNDITLFETLLDDYGVQPSDDLFRQTVSKRRFTFSESLLSRGVDANTALTVAMQNNTKQLIRPALDAGADAGVVLDYAISKTDLTLASEAIGQYGASPDRGLPQAVEKNNTQMITLLLDNNANPDLGMPVAIQKNNINLVRTLLDKGARPDEYLKTCVDNDQEEMVKELVLKGADPNSGLKYAMNGNNYSIATMMIEGGADAYGIVEVAVNEKQTELLRAALNAGDAPDPGMPASIRNNNTEYIKLLLDAGADATIPEYVKSAAEFENMTVISALLAKGASPDPALPIAFSKNNTSMAIALLDSGADPNNPEYLVQSVKSSNVTLIDALLSRHVDPNPGMSTAVSGGNTPIVRKLINAGADATPQGFIASAAKQNKSEMVTLLLEHQADPNAGMPNAVSGGYTPIVSTLINHGADGSPAQYIQTACELQNVQMVDVLLKANADPNAGMEVSVQKDNTQLVNLLLTSGADATPAAYITAACTNANLAMTTMLLNAGADPNPGMTPGVKGNHVEIVRMLLTSGADGTHTDLIAGAAAHNNPILTGLLIDAGANPEAALEPAVSSNADKVIRQIKEKGVDVTDPELLAKTVTSSFVASTNELLEGGSDPNAWVEASTGYTVLHHACKAANLSMMKLLIDKGADVNAEVQGSKLTPLHMVVGLGKKYLEHVETLITAGADVNARDAQGVIVFKKAKGSKVKKLLKKHDAIKK